jgi:ABC-type lipoprotein export system ATPase subunit
MDINSITIIRGHGKDNQSDAIERLHLEMGAVVSIVGPTGSGKTTLINDIALFANENTPSGRTVLINNALPPEEFIHDPSKNPIAFITQHTNFISDLPVNKFLRYHASIRQTRGIDSIVEEVLDFANKLTGEPIIVDNSMTELSGGQTRALLIADAVIVGDSPIILLDEIENAGIDRTRALELLRHYEKIFIFVTHDPRITLLSDFRVVMKAGRMTQLLTTHEVEKRAVLEIKKLDDLLLGLRSKIREGEIIFDTYIKEQLGLCGYVETA